MTERETALATRIAAFCKEWAKGDPRPDFGHKVTRLLFAASLAKELLKPQVKAEAERKTY